MTDPATIKGGWQPFSRELVEAAIKHSELELSGPRGSMVHAALVVCVRGCLYKMDQMQHELDRLTDER